MIFGENFKSMNTIKFTTNYFRIKRMGLSSFILGIHMLLFLMK